MIPVATFTYQVLIGLIVTVPIAVVLAPDKVKEFPVETGLLCTTLVVLWIGTRMV